MITVAFQAEKRTLSKWCNIHNYFSK